MSPARGWALFLIVVAAALVNLSAAAARAPEDDLWSAPTGTIAYWAFDPSFLGESAASDPNRALLEAGLVGLASNVFTPEGRGRSPVASLLDPTVLKEAPYRVVLLDLAIESGPDPAPGTPAELVGLSLVFEIRSPDRHLVFEAVLREAAEAWAKSAGVELREETFEAKPETDGHSLRAPGSDDRFQLSWVSLPESFTVGVGPAALRDWFDRGREGPAAWVDHRRASGEIHGEAQPLLEAFVDLDALRRRAPDELGWGSLGSLLHAWRIANARSFMVGASLSKEPESGPRLVNIAVSWSSRALPVGNTRAMQLTTALWPQTLGAPPGDAAYAIVIPAAWTTWVPMGMQTYRALAPEDATFPRRADAWLRRSLPALQRVIAQGLGVVAVTGPGKATSGPALRIPLRRGAPTQRITTDLEQVLGSLTPYVMYTPGGRVWAIDPRPEVGGAPFFLSLRGEQIVGAWELDQLPTGTGR